MSIEQISAASLEQIVTTRLDQIIATGIEQIIAKHSQDVQRFVESGELTDALYEALFDFYAVAGEMPYGTMKARTGDPYQWIAQHFSQFLSASAHI